jgi:hypothetical protein
VVLGAVRAGIGGGDGDSCGDSGVVARRQANG